MRDEKELSEHNMLVDLGRNDIGKISVPGIVRVEKYLGIERFSHVMHIGSTVSGQIRQDRDSVPEKEFDECLNKAGAVLQAVRSAEGGMG